MIVADTNLIVHLLITGTHTSTAEDVLRADSDWRAPVLWQSELRHVLWKLTRGEILSLDDAMGALERAEQLITSAKLTTPSTDILRLAGYTACSPYDCEFAALASELHCRLVTWDKALLAGFPESAVLPRDFLKATNG